MQIDEGERYKKAFGGLILLYRNGNRQLKRNDHRDRRAVGYPVPVNSRRSGNMHIGHVSYTRWKRMKFVIQRVARASVTVDGETAGAISKGLLVLIGVGQDDKKEDADRLVKKMINLRIFEDGQGKTNLALKDVGGELLLVSQFTLYADCRKGNRPSFINAGKPEMAEEMYEYIIEQCRKQVEKVERGVFGGDMKVELVNDGPFTIILDESI